MNYIPVLQLILAKGIGEAAIKKFYKYTINKNTNLEEILKTPIDIWAKDLELNFEIAESILKAQDHARNLYDELTNNNISFFWIGDNLYPEKLKETLTKDAPSFIFFKGNIELFKEPSVGFCGSRKASEKGLQITENSAKIFAKENICVVSGYANGVDFIAHKASLQANGSTIIVLSEGILKFKEKKEINNFFNSKNHLIISQFPPHLNWIARNAMKRNKTIIGLSNAMILVESGKKGGTYAAGQDTIRYERPLFVIDYASPGIEAEGNPFFILRGGIPIRGSAESKIPNLVKVIEVIKNNNSKKSEIERFLF